MESAIYVVATPIGNLADISYRAIEVLQGVDMIAAEDTRHTRRLLDHYGIEKKMVSLHEHNEASRAEELLAIVESGKSLALVSDAGTPLISDPGHILIKMARERAVRLSPVPGASAVTAALSVAGIACGKFIFEGFLPAKEKQKRDLLESYRYESKAVVFYESPHRVMSTMQVVSELYPGRECVVARELTKHFETIKKAPAIELFQWMVDDENQQRGEFVLVLSGETNPESRVSEREKRQMLQRLLADLAPKKAAAVMSDIYGESKKVFYNWALEIKNED